MMQCDLANFLGKISNSIPQVTKELSPLLTVHFVHHIADIGCGSGYRTYALLGQMCPKTILGIDIDEMAISTAERCRHELLRITTRQVKEISIEAEIPTSLLTMISNGLLPNFVCADVSTEPVPRLSNHPLDLAYCRRLLVNIYNECGESAVITTLSTISRELRRGGFFVAIEESQGGDFSQLIEQRGFLKKEVGGFTYSGEVLPYTRYIYVKK